MKKITLVLFLFVLLSTLTSPFIAFAALPQPTPDTSLPFFVQAPPPDQCGEIGQACCQGNGAVPKITNNPLANTPIVGGFVQTFIDFFNNTITGAFNEQSNVGKLISQATLAAGGRGNGTWCKAGTSSEGVTSGLNLQATCTCIALGGMANLSDKCKLLKIPNEQQECQTCVNPVNPKGYWTAIGCVSLSFEDFIRDVIFKFGLGLAGVTAFGCIIYSAISLQLSQGSPEKIKKSQEMLTSCILGLILIIFSVFILRTIGVTVLQIPGLK